VHPEGDTTVPLEQSERYAAAARVAGDDVVVTGRVPSVEPYFERAQVIVCPLREGGGVKVKVLEALARGKAVVTTSVGVQGLGPAADDALRVEDRPRRFARAVAEILRDETERRRLEQAAKALAATLPTWDDAVDGLIGCYQELATPVVAHD
jgi:glycosyltransferase involved in cell wall biosynthesis